jgi:hypothetical protein
VTITDRMAAWRRERRVLQRVSGRRGGWSRPSGNAPGHWPRPARRESRSARWRPRRDSSRPGCTRSRRARRAGGTAVIEWVRAWSSSRREPTYCYVNRYRPLSFTTTSSSPRPGPTSPSTSQRSRGLCASCRLFLGTNDRPVKRLDNGRLSGTTAGESLDGDPHGAQRPYVDPLARCRQRRLHEYVAVSTSERQPLARRLAVTGSENSVGATTGHSVHIADYALENFQVQALRTAPISAIPACLMRARWG